MQGESHIQIYFEKDIYYSLFNFDVYWSFIDYWKMGQYF